MSESQILIARLNAKLQPIHRGEIFEDPLDAELKKSSLGSVSGGGTQMAKTGEIAYCDVEIDVSAPSDAVAASVIGILERLGAPKGSKLLVAQGHEIPFGSTEGLAVYLNGSDLPKSVYEECDANFVYSEFDRLLGGIGQVFSYWEGASETALYIYGGSFDAMKSRLEKFLTSYPLCQQCRVVQIA
jgi:hypothetical protein